MTAMETASGAYMQLLSFDPDLTVPAADQNSYDFLLVAAVDPTTTRVPQLTVFENLDVPLLKGQTLYWGGAAPDIFQLSFS